MTPLVRQLSSVPQMHRQATLQAISSKTHATTSRIEFIRAESDRMRVLLENLPEDTGSRLDWLNRQLSNNG